MDMSRRRTRDRKDTTSSEGDGPSLEYTFQSSKSFRFTIARSSVRRLRPHDTGPLHLAGITSTAIVAIFGPTDPRGRLPQRSNCVALWGGEGFACRPCYDGRDYAPCEHNGCMRQITPAMAFGEVETLLAARREGRDLLPRVRTPKHTPVATLTQLKGTRS